MVGEGGKGLGDDDVNDRVRDARRSWDRWNERLWWHGTAVAEGQDDGCLQEGQEVSTDSPRDTHPNNTVHKDAHERGLTRNGTRRIRRRRMTLVSAQRGAALPPWCIGGARNWDCCFEQNS